MKNLMHMSWGTAAYAVFFTTLGLLLSFVPGISQQSSPSGLPGCVYLATPITLVDRQQSVMYCDINGRLKVTTTP